MPAYPENVRSPGLTGSRRGPAKPTRRPTTDSGHPREKLRGYGRSTIPSSLGARQYRVPSSLFMYRPISPAEIRTCDMLWSSRCCLGRRSLLGQNLSIVTSGSRRLEERANPASLNFGRNFGEGQGHNYSSCVTDQTNKAIDDCVGGSESSNCVLEKSLRVLEVCDLSSC